MCREAVPSLTSGSQLSWRALKPRRWMWAAWAGWLAVLLVPKAGGFPYPPLAVISDIVVAHVPQILYLRRALTAWHTLPLWAPTYYSGYPFYADPLAGLWYPPGWLAVVLPLPWGLSLTVGLHWLLSAVGMYAFLRVLGRRETSAFLGALAWLGFGKVWAHWGGGHLTLVYAVAWTPWLLLASCRRGRWLRPGVVLALIFLADPRWAAYAGGLWAAWELVGVAARQRSWARRVLALAVEGGLGALLAAPLWLPLLRFTRLSTRAHLTPHDVLVFSLPWERLLGLLAPAGGMTEWVAYAGAGVILLAVAAWAAGRARFWGGVALVALLWALGSHLPGEAWLARLPGVSLLRVPPRGLFLLGFAMAAAAAAGWETLAEMGQSSARRRNLLWFGAITLGMVVSLVLGWALGAFWVGLHGLLAWGVAALLAWAMSRPGAAARGHWRYWAAFLALDLLWMASSQVMAVPPQRAFSTPAVLEAASASSPALFRFYTPSYSIPQQVAAAHGWELANGVDPLVLEAYARFMARASGVPLEGYSVVVPPLPNSDLEADRNARPDAALLGLLNVTVVAAAYPVEAAGLVPLAHGDGLWVYRNTLARPRAWVETAAGWHPAVAVAWQPNRVSVTAEGAGRLVLSEIAYPGWQVTVDGRPASATTAYGVLRAITLPAGRHEVVWRFVPWDLYVGLALALLGVLLAWRLPRFGL